MKTKLRVLMVEDYEDDAILIMRLLQRGGFDLEWQRVDNRADLLRALDQGPWDLMITDYSLPGFSGKEVLEIYKQRKLDFPFIMVSGTIGEDIAVEAMKAGAHDYIMKDNLKRLVPAVKREIKEAAERQKRRQVEEALRISQQKYRMLVDSLPDVIFQTDRKGRLIFLNPTWKEITGYDPETCHQKELVSFVATADRRRIAEQIRQLIAGRKKEYRGMMRLLTSEKSHRWVEIRATLLAGEPAESGISGLLRDITEKKKAEENLMREKNFSDSIISSIPGVFYLVDPGGRLQRWNKNLEELTGCTGTELRRMRFAELFNEADRELIARAVKTVFSGHDMHFEARLHSADGAGRTFLLSGKRILHNDRPYMVGTGIDISEQKRTEAEKQMLHEQLIQSQKMEAVGRLAGGIAHDFNNILSVIMGSSELLRSRHPQDAFVEEELQQIQVAAERAKELTSQLLAFSRKQTLEMKVVNLNEIIARVQKMLKRLLREDIELVIKLHPDLMNIKADPGQLEQVLINLAINAQDAMPDGGVITIETGHVAIEREKLPQFADLQAGDYTLLKFSDTGMGMDRATRAQVFDPFFTTKKSGTGLGLSTVYGIIKQHGGHIWLESERGAGATFNIVFPQIPEKIMDGMFDVKMPHQRGRNELVMVVEDDPAVRNIVTKMLQENNYRVIAVENPEKAIHLAAQKKDSIDLLLTDVIMPGLNGKELYEEVRRYCPQIRVLFMSGYTDDIINQDAFPASETHFLQKPFTMEKLCEKVREVLDLPQDRTRNASGQKSQA
ncbi:MAG: response regulator [candidate division KSB1 bacterium]|nr:response regulator [candidate division KSB1 bacterium]